MIKLLVVYTLICVLIVRSSSLHIFLLFIVVVIVRRRHPKIIMFAYVMRNWSIYRNVCLWTPTLRYIGCIVSLNIKSYHKIEVNFVAIYKFKLLLSTRMKWNGKKNNNNTDGKLHSMNILYLLPQANFFSAISIESEQE